MSNDSELVVPETPPRRGRPGFLVVAGLALLAALAGALVWTLAYRIGQLAAALVAVAAGAAIGLAVRRGGRTGVIAGTVAVILTIVAGAVGSNFAQRHELISGITRLQQDWAELAVSATAGPSDEPLQDDPGCISHAVPPKQILAVLPAAALLCMSAADLATVWADVPQEKRAELPKAARDKVEAVLAGSTEEQLAKSRADYESAAYAIPAAVIACAPPPDFTQSTAAAGLGFPNGVPLLLPRAELFDDNRARGDGLRPDPPTPSCFVRENAKENPLEPISWLLAAMVAFVIPFRARRVT